MSAKELDELVKKVESLKPDEQLFLISHIARNLQEGCPKLKRHRKWREICGSIPYPFFGEDAQSWLSRTRSEGDDTSFSVV